MERLRPPTPEAVAQSSEPQRIPDGFELRERVEKEPPTDPEEIYACLLNVCHLELGALTYLSLTETLPEAPPGKTPRKLSYEISPTAHGITKTQRSVQITQITDYLEHIFIDVSLVARESYFHAATGQKITFYSLTPFGKKYQAVAYFLLSQLTELNERNQTDFALPQILTKSANASYKRGEQQERLPPIRRGPYLRAKIIEELEKLQGDESLSNENIATSLRLNPRTVTNHLKDLRNTNPEIVFYESVDTEKKGQFVYNSTVGSLLPNMVRLRHLSSAVSTLMLEYMQSILQNNPNSTFSTPALTETLYPVYCQNQFSKGFEPVRKWIFEDYVSRVLANLRKAGYLRSEYVPCEVQSHARLAPLGKELASILARARQACEDPLVLQHMDKEFKVSFEDFVSKHAEVLLTRQKEHGQKHGSKEDRFRMLCDLLQNKPEGMRKKEIDENMGIRTHMLLSEFTKNDILEQQWSIAKSTKGAFHGKASTYTLSPRTREILEQHPGISYEDLKALMEHPSS